MRNASAMSLAVVALACGAVYAGGDEVVVKGVDHYRVVEPMFEGVRVALAHHGASYSPAYVQGISGAAFRIAGPCPCAPTCSGAMNAYDLARLLGRCVELGVVTGMGDARKQSWLALAERVKAELAAGRPVLVWSAFTNYEWDVVCGFDEATGEWLGYGSYAGGDEPARGPLTRPVDYSDVTDTLALFIADKADGFDAREAELLALEAAVRHSRTPADRYVTETDSGEVGWLFREGECVYTVWARRFESDPMRVPDGGSDRYPLGVYSSTHEAAAEFLREIGPKYPRARAHLERAADCFAADGAALTECYDRLCGKWEGWREPNPGKAAHMAELLRSAHASYVSGIDEIAAALEVIDPDRAGRANARAAMRRNNGEVTIEGIGSLVWGQGKDWTYAGALEQALKVTEHPYTYAEIMGLSGLAFGLRWCNDDTKTQWCPSSACGEGPLEGEALEELTGWEMAGEWAEGSVDPDATSLRVKASIDSGRPVAAYLTSWDVGLITGYEDAGRVLIGEEYSDHHGRTVRPPVEKLLPLRIYLGEYRQPPPLRETIRTALGRAVAQWRQVKGDWGIEGREYWYGEAALRAWIADLRRYGAMPEETRDKLRSLDPWVYTHLLDARRAATSVLPLWGQAVGGEAGAALERARAAYESECKLLEPFLPAKRPVGPEGEWTLAAIDREVAVLEQAQALETEAVTALEAALRALQGE